MLNKDFLKIYLKYKEAISLSYSCLFYKNTNVLEGYDHFYQHSVVIKSNFCPQAVFFQYDPVIRRNCGWLHFNWKHISVQNWALEHEKGTVVAPACVSIWGSNLNVSGYSVRLLAMQRSRKSKLGYPRMLLMQNK